MSSAHRRSNMCLLLHLLFFEKGFPWGFIQVVRANGTLLMTDVKGIYDTTGEVVAAKCTDKLSFLLLSQFFFWKDELMR